MPIIVTGGDRKRSYVPYKKFIARFERELKANNIVDILNSKQESQGGLSYSSAGVDSLTNHWDPSVSVDEILKDLVDDMGGEISVQFQVTRWYKHWFSVQKMTTSQIREFHESRNPDHPVALVDESQGWEIAK